MLILFGLLEGVGDGQRNDEEPVGRHDEDLVDAKAQYQMDEHVEAEVGEAHPEKARTPATTEADGKKQQDNPLDNIAPQPVVLHEHRTEHQCVLQEMLAMKLDGLANEVVISVHFQKP